MNNYHIVTAVEIAGALGKRKTSFYRPIFLKTKKATSVCCCRLSVTVST